MLLRDRYMNALISQMAKDFGIAPFFVVVIVVVVVVIDDCHANECYECYEYYECYECCGIGSAR